MPHTLSGSISLCFFNIVLRVCTHIVVVVGCLLVIDLNLEFWLILTFSSLPSYDFPCPSPSGAPTIIIISHISPCLFVFVHVPTHLAIGTGFVCVILPLHCFVPSCDFPCPDFFSSWRSYNCPSPSQDCVDVISLSLCPCSPLIALPLCKNHHCARYCDPSTCFTNIFLGHVQFIIIQG